MYIALPTFQVGCSFANEMEDYSASFHHAFPAHNIQLGGLLEKKGQDVQGALGFSQSIDEDTTVRTTLRSNGRLGAVIERKADRHMMLRCSAEVDSGLNRHRSSVCVCLCV